MAQPVDAVQYRQEEDRQCLFGHAMGKMGKNGQQTTYPFHTCLVF